MPLGLHILQLVGLILMLASSGLLADNSDNTLPSGGRTYPAQTTVMIHGSNQLMAGPVQQRERVFALVSLQAGGVLAVGARGLMLLQDEAGGEWRRLAAPTGQPNLYSAVQDSSGRLWFGSDAGQLYIANSTLSEWQVSTLEQKDVIFALAQLPGGRMLAAGQYGLLSLYSPERDNWEEIAMPWKWGEWLKPAWAELGEAAPHLYGICNIGASTLVVGEFGLVVEFDGHIWHHRRGGTIEPALYGCAAGEGAEVVAVGQTGIIEYSRDGGKLWQSASVSSPSSMYQAVWASDRWVAVGEEGKLWWAAQPQGPWACSRIGKSATGWFIDVLQSTTVEPGIVLGGAGELRKLPLSAVGSEGLQGACNG